jgi:site-specific DNA recombinase
MNIAIYARVSSDTQTREGTINSQIEALRDYAQANNLTIVQECLDDGFSGAELNRPGLDQLRDIAQDGLIDAILVLSPDRLSRKQANQIILLEEFKKGNIQVLFTNQKSGDTPEDNLMLQIQGAISEYERAKIADRVRRGTKHAVKNGQVIGNFAPYGYRFVAKNGNTLAHWEINPEEAEIVRLIFDLYTNKKLNSRAISRHLGENGILTRSGAKWWESTILDILKNETYLGIAYMFKNKSVTPGKNPKLKKYRKRKNSAKEARPREDWIGIPVTQIIERELWESAQRQLKENAYRSRRNNNKHNYLLRGLVVCGLCGSIASGYVSNKSTYYSCGAKRNKNITTKPHDENIIVKHPDFDSRVWAGLVELLDNPDNLKAQLEKRLEMHRNSMPIETRVSDKDDKMLEKLATQEKRILDAYREGAIDLDELKEQKAKIAAKRETLESRKKPVLSHSESPGQQEITLDMLGDVSARFKRVMKKADFATREKLVNLLVNSVTLFPDKTKIEGSIPVTKLDVLSGAANWTPFFLDSPAGGRCIIFLEDPMEKLDLKKTLKKYYDAKQAPVFIEIPAMNFLMLDGSGNPNTSAEYANAVQALFAVAYTLKFKVKKEMGIDYPVKALEGLWWTEDMRLFSQEKKEDWLWTMMISTPDFISKDQVAAASAEASRKKDLPAVNKIRFAIFKEGLAAQLMHIGPYSTEAENIQRLHAFIHANGHSFDGLENKHHEIYLSDPRKSAPEKLKTIIRQPVKA